MVTLGDGTAINLVRAGDPRGELTVVLVHSYALDHRVWHRIVDVLPTATERPIQVLAYDHRGHGDSGPATERTATVEQLGSDLAELIERAVPDGPVILVGHGVGGLVCLAPVARHHELFTARVAGLVLLSTGAGRLTGEALPRSVGRLAQDLELILGSRILGQALGKAKTIGLRWLLLGDDPDPDDVRLVADMISRHWPDTVALFRTTLGPDDREAALAAVLDTPVLAVAGERDRLVPAGHAEALAGAVRHGVGVILPGMGHMLPLEGSAEIIPRIVGQVHAALRSL